VPLRTCSGQSVLLSQCPEDERVSGCVHEDRDSGGGGVWIPIANNDNIPNDDGNSTLTNDDGNSTLTNEEGGDENNNSTGTSSDGEGGPPLNSTTEEDETPTLAPAPGVRGSNTSIVTSPEAVVTAPASGATSRRRADAPLLATGVAVVLTGVMCLMG